MKPLPPLEEITALAGHEFPGGTYKVEHWEVSYNFKLVFTIGCRRSRVDSVFAQGYYDG